MPRVLVIDDESHVRTLIAAMLDRKGIRVEKARDGREGLCKARENPPDLILRDLTMPVMGGIETLAESRRDAALRSVPFLVVTGMAHSLEEAGLVGAGAVGLLPTPFTSDTLIEAVAPHLKGAGRDGAMLNRPALATAPSAGEGSPRV